MQRRSVFSALATAMVLALTMASATMGAASHRMVVIHDNCDGPSFNAVLGDGACERPSGMTFERFGELLARGGAQSWRFSPERIALGDGGSVTAINRGGETHTFSRVAAFGGGCVPPIFTALGVAPNPAADCATLPTTLIAPGETRNTGALDTGTYLYQCLIHPWQRTTINVR
jgi:plastocyanin